MREICHWQFPRPSLRPNDKAPSKLSSRCHLWLTNYNYLRAGLSMTYFMRHYSTLTKKPVSMEVILLSHLQRLLMEKRSSKSKILSIIGDTVQGSSFNTSSSGRATLHVTTHGNQLSQYTHPTYSGSITQDTRYKRIRDRIKGAPPTFDNDRFKSNTTTTPTTSHVLNHSQPQPHRL